MEPFFFSFLRGLLFYLDAAYHGSRRRAARAALEQLEWPIRAAAERKRREKQERFWFFCLFPSLFLKRRRKMRESGEFFFSFRLFPTPHPRKEKRRKLREKKIKTRNFTCLLKQRTGEVFVEKEEGIFFGGINLQLKKLRLQLSSRRQSSLQVSFFLLLFFPLFTRVAPPSQSGTCALRSFPSTPVGWVDAVAGEGRCAGRRRRRKSWNWLFDVVFWRWCFLPPAKAICSAQYSSARAFNCPGPVARRFPTISMAVSDWLRRDRTSGCLWAALGLVAKQSNNFSCFSP